MLEEAEIRYTGILLTGRSGTGKTTLARHLEMLGFQYRSAGDFIRQVSGLENGSRELLTQFGLRYVDSIGEVGFADQLASKLPDSGKWVLEGVRPLESLLYLRRTLPCVLVYLGVSDEVRRARLTARGDGRSAIFLQASVMEQEVERARDFADLTLIADEPPSMLAAKVEGLFFGCSRESGTKLY